MLIYFGIIPSKGILKFQTKPASLFLFSVQQKPAWLQNCRDLQLLWYLYSIMKWKIPWCSGLAFYNAKNNRYCKWIVPNFSSRILKYIFSHETTFQKSWLDGHKWFYPWEFSNLMSWVEPHPALNCEGSVLSITNHITFIQFAASSFLSYHWSKSRHTQFHWRSMNICCRRRREENIHFVKRFLIVILLQNSYVDI